LYLEQFFQKKANESFDAVDRECERRGCEVVVDPDPTVNVSAVVLFQMECTRLERDRMY
jgi:hypothetical protein